MGSSDGCEVCELYVKMPPREGGAALPQQEEAEQHAAQASFFYVPSMRSGG